MIHERKWMKLYRNAEGGGSSPTPSAPEPTATPTATPEPTESFAVPEAYKDKGWAKNLKSTDDVYKMLDNAQALAGKKLVVPDFEKATPEEVEAYVANLRPKDKAAYKLPDTIPEGERGPIIDALHKVGLPAPLANGLMNELMGHITGSVEKLYDKESFDKELETSFGEKWQETGGKTAKTISEMVSKEDKEFLEEVPNQYLGLIYRIVDKMNQKYGAKETGAGGEGGEGSGGGIQDVEAVRADLRKQIADIDKRAHTGEEKQALKDKLAATYPKG